MQKASRLLALGDVLLLEAKFFREPGKGVGFFDGVKVFALKVFDQGKFEDFLVGGFADDDRGFQEADSLGGPPAAFAGDQLEVIAALACDQGLDNAVLFDRVDEFLEVLVPENRARLQRGGTDQGELYELHPFALLHCGGGRDDWRLGPGADEGTESFAEGYF